MILTARGLTKSFGALKALDGIDLALAPGTILGVIGPNGSGKTTLFNLLSGRLRPDAGRVWLGEREITGLPAWRICRLGLALTSQVASPFGEMTVAENVVTAAHYGAGVPLAQARTSARHTLELVGLDQRLDQQASELTVSQSRRLDLARALATQPKVLLLDENLAGLNPLEVQHSLELLARLRAQGLSMILVEHVVRAVVDICDQVLVLDYGRAIALGEPAQVMGCREVVQAYLGEDYAGTQGA